MPIEIRVNNPTPQMMYAHAGRSFAVTVINDTTPTDDLTGWTIVGQVIAVKGGALLQTMSVSGTVTRSVTMTPTQMTGLASTSQPHRRAWYEIIGTAPSGQVYTLGHGSLVVDS